MARVTKRAMLAMVTKGSNAQHSFAMVWPTYNGHSEWRL